MGFFPFVVSVMRDKIVLFVSGFARFWLRVLSLETFVSFVAVPAGAECLEAVENCERCSCLVCLLKLSLDLAFVAVVGGAVLAVFVLDLRVH